jgi:hypothetical protein
VVIFEVVLLVPLKQDTEASWWYGEAIPFGASLWSFVTLVLKEPATPGLDIRSANTARRSFGM